MKTERETSEEKITPESIAEKIFDEAVENIRDKRNHYGLSPSLKNDWANYIEQLEDQHNKEIEELKRLYSLKPANLIQAEEVSKIIIDQFQKELKEIRDSLRIDDSGREGCTYGDTDYDSLSAVYGYNLAISELIKILNKHIK